VNTTNFLARYPVFSLELAQRELDGNARKRVLYAVQTGKAVMLRRGLFATMPNGQNPDRYLVMAALRPDCVISGHSALELLGLAHSEWTLCSAYSDRRRTRFVICSIEYVVAVPPASLVRESMCGLGVLSRTRDGIPIRCLGPERCLVDGFDRPRLFGGVVELVRSLDGLRLLDFDLLEQLLVINGSRTLFGAVGWFLERNRVNLFVPEPLLTKLQTMRPRSPHYLDRKSGNAHLDKRWNILTPRELRRGEGQDD